MAEVVRLRGLLLLQPPAGPFAGITIIFLEITTMEVVGAENQRRTP